MAKTHLPNSPDEKLTGGTMGASVVTLAVSLCLSLAGPAACAASDPAGASRDAVAAQQGIPGSSAICSDGPLEILLTNDDGYQAPGIRALYDALRKAGHHVRLAAPAANASGSSVSFTWSNVDVVHDPEDANIAGITATPATAVVLGATALYPPGQRPDLVVSGINDGENTGSLLAMSGTVGAALAGTMLLDPSVPGFAINAERAATKEAQAALPADRLERIATHVAQLIGSARGWFCEGATLTRPTTVLNVNYPARPMTAIRGVAVARQGRTTDLHVDFESTDAASYSSHVRLQSATGDYPDSDVNLLAAGYVTVTPISASLGVTSVSLEDLKRRLEATTERGSSRNVGKGLRGEAAAIADAEAMVETMGGMTLWAQLKRIHFVHQWYPWNRKDSYVENEVLDLTGPRSWVDRRSEVNHAMRAYSPEGKRWDVHDGEIAFAGKDALEADLKRAPFNFYRLVRAVAVGDPYYEVRFGPGDIPGTRRLEFRGPDGVLGGWVILNASKEPIVKATPEYRYTLGPLGNFGNLRIPAWGVYDNGTTRYDLLSVEGGKQPPDPSLFQPPAESRP